eukprot:2089228-Prorocentrum_lima.AAC.1
MNRSTPRLWGATAMLRCQASDFPCSSCGGTASSFTCSCVLVSGFGARRTRVGGNVKISCSRA